MARLPNFLVPGTALRNCMGIGGGVDGENGNENPASENRRPIDAEIGAGTFPFPNSEALPRAASSHWERPLLVGGSNRH